MYCINNKKRNRYDLQHHTNGLIDLVTPDQHISMKNQIHLEGRKIYICKEINETILLQEMIIQVMNLKKRYIESKEVNYQVVLGPKGNQIYIENNIQLETNIITQIIQEMQTNLNIFKMSLLKDNLFNDYQFQINEGNLTIFSERDNFIETVDLFNDKTGMNMKNTVTNYNIDYKFSNANKLMAQLIIEIPHCNYYGDNNNNSNNSNNNSSYNISAFDEPEYLSCYSRDTQEDPTYRALEQIRLEYMHRQNITSKRMRCQ
ncbi:hypothetical protein, no similarity [Maudiozyma barnettii]|nr:hypothetical protein, no similarity [Kazachstania barnettii]